MTMLEGQAGPQKLGKTGDGKLRLGNTGEMIKSEYLARYAQIGLDGNSFSAANQAAQAVSVTLATTYTGLMLYNPPNSGKILIPKKIKFALSVAQVAIATIGLIGGWAAGGGVTAQTAKLGVQPTQIGNGGVGVGIPLSQATIVTPTWVAHFTDGFTAGAFGGPQAPIDLDGTFQILPGGFLGIGALTAVTGMGFLTWDEVDILS